MNCFKFHNVVADFCSACSKFLYCIVFFVVVVVVAVVTVVVVVVVVVVVLLVCFCDLVFVVVV